MKKTRIKYTITASVDKNSDEFEKFCKLVEEGISYLTGGCLVLNGKGYWSQLATECRDKYPEVFEEFAHRLEVTSDTDIYGDIIGVYQHAKERSAANVEWIDCNVQEVEAKHFNI